MIKIKTFAYIRVSSAEQNEARQLDAIKDISVDKVFADKISGKDFERPQYKKMIKRLKKGDVIYILSIDRLGRNYDEILAQWRLITKDIGADIVVIDMPLLDTRQSNNLMGTVIADIVLQLLSFVAEKERENIRERQRQGIASAKERNVQFGRPKSCDNKKFDKYIEKYLQKEMTVEEISEKCGISQRTIYRKLKEIRENPIGK